jgi:hypothetical protein
MALISCWSLDFLEDRHLITNTWDDVDDDDDDNNNNNNTNNNNNNNNNNTESTAVWSLKPERWGSPLVQEKYREEMPVTETSVSYNNNNNYYYYYYYMVTFSIKLNRLLCLLSRSWDSSVDIEARLYGDVQGNRCRWNCSLQQINQT